MENPFKVGDIITSKFHSINEMIVIRIQDDLVESKFIYQDNIICSGGYHLYKYLKIKDFTDEILCLESEIKALKKELKTMKNKIEKLVSKKNQLKNTLN